MKQAREFIKRMPLIGSIAKAIVAYIRRASFRGSRKYWESRYDSGGTSGDGSYGKLAEFKAEVVNSFIREHGIRSVLELGCGDGNQLTLASYPEYIGLDVSRSAMKLCKERFKHDKTKSFFLYDTDCFVDVHSIFRSELTLSLDVIYHLVENRIFELYMKHLFSAAEKFVIIYSSDTDVNPSRVPHIRYRHFSEWVKVNFPEWKLIRRITNKYPFRGNDKTGSLSDFFIYEKT